MVKIPILKYWAPCIYGVQTEGVWDDLNLLTCFRILLLFNNTPSVHSREWWLGWEVYKIGHFLEHHKFMAPCTIFVSEGFNGKISNKRFIRKPELLDIWTKHCSVISMSCVIFKKQVLTFCLLMMQAFLVLRIFSEMT